MSETASSATEHRRVLAMMAHPDDAEFLCAGTLIRLAEAGWEVHIATVACGDCGTTTETLWAISRAAHRRGPAGGRSDPGHISLPRRVRWFRGLRQAEFAEVRRSVPPRCARLVFLHTPSDYMMDHVMASLLGRAASFIYAAPNASEFPLLPGSQVPHLYYCDPIEGLDPFGHPVEPSTWWTSRPS